MKSLMVLAQAARFVPVIARLMQFQVNDAKLMLLTLMFAYAAEYVCKYAISMRS